MSDSKSKIPKFGSFRPKPVLPVDSQAKKDSKDHSDFKAQQSEKEHRRRHHGSPQSRRTDIHQSSAVAINTSQLPPNNESQELFVVDKKGDEKNLVYGSIHRYSVPPFHRFGAGRVLGLPSDMRIDRDIGDAKEIVIRDWRKSEIRSREKNVFSKIERERPRLLKIRPEGTDEDPVEQEADYVPLQAQKWNKHRSVGAGDREASTSESDDRDYRSIYGKSKHNQPYDDALKYATESESSGSETGRTINVDSLIQRKNAELSRRVEKSPRDIETWLALIDHQDALLRREDGRRITNAEIKSTADIKMHMYEKALQNFKSLKDRERLMLGLMQEGTKIWEVKIQAKRWEEISKENIDSLVLWTNYLNFKQTNFSTFRFEDVKELYVKRIRLLLETLSTTSTDIRDDLQCQLVYILLRLTLFLRESGYGELAIATWQGLLEINFSSSKQPHSTLDARKQFRDFWDSEIPRIGQDGALGWDQFLENTNSSDVPDPLADQVDDALDRKDIFRTWASAERQRSEGLLPARTMDEVVEDDPFRVILFSDIEDFLVLFPSKSNIYTLLLNCYLLFCRLPTIAAKNEELPQKFLVDAFVGSDFLECDPGLVERKYLAAGHGVMDDLSTENTDVMLSSISPESKFKDNNWYNIANWRVRYGGDKGPVSYKWVRNCLKRLVQAYFQEDLAEYYLAFEYQNEPETIKKVSKGLLKLHPASLRLYNSYAMIESARGNQDIASGVFTAALNMSIGNSQEELSRESVLLWRNWVWVCLDNRDHSSALQHLLSMPKGTPGIPTSASPAVFLKSKQYLTSNRDFLVSSGDFGTSLFYAECLALLEYLATASTKESTSQAQGNIEAALNAYTSFSQTLQSRPRTELSHQRLLESATRLLYHHTQTGPFRPALLRQHLTNFIILFPQNISFLTVYTWNEARLGIDNRVRFILQSTVLTPDHDNLTSRIFAICHEISHGTVHSARAAFEHALSSPTSQSSPGLWRFYILFCLEKREFRGKAREVWYRAIRACPWVKELYILGFERLGGQTGEEYGELKGTWRVLEEKGLRIHVDLEEHFEEIEEKGKGRSLGYK